MEKLVDRIQSIGCHERVPENFVEKWGGEWGCPAKDADGKVIGYCAEKPDHESQWNNAVSTFMAL